MVLKWLPVSSNQAIDGEAPELGDSPIKAGEAGAGAEDGGLLAALLAPAASAACVRACVAWRAAGLACRCSCKDAPAART